MSLIPIDPAALAEGAARLVEDPRGLEPSGLVVVRSGGAIAVYANRCPHAGRRLDYAPGKFMARGGELVCPAHGARFALADGACLGGPCRGEGLERVPVLADGGGPASSRRSGAGD
ncbi:MAG: Rieske 2Fe-2S domain-containing protein [Xanthomonadales bacterium]|nr:Rieske 2Fe-2S domain-containing protein [Xanthomonadales bacterium]